MACRNVTLEVNAASDALLKQQTVCQAASEKLTILTRMHKDKKYALSVAEGQQEVTHHNATGGHADSGSEDQELDQVDFWPASRPEGEHAGFVFKIGHLGLGYYRNEALMPAVPVRESDPEIKELRRKVAEVERRKAQAAEQESESFLLITRLRVRQGLGDLAGIRQELALAQRGVERLEACLARQALRKPTTWRKQTTKVFKVELRAKKQRLEELTQACNQYGFILEDLHERKSLRFKALQDIQEVQQKIKVEIEQVQADVFRAQASLAEAEATEETLRTRSQALSQEFAEKGETAVVVKILRRVTLPQELPRRAVEVANQAKMDWCCITAGTSGKPTSLSIEEFMDSPECGLLQSLYQLNGPSGQRFLYWIPSNDHQDGRYVTLRGKLWPKLTSPVYKHPPIKLNFFELLRASLGDAQFSDVWLVPEAPHFHQKALGLDRMTDIKPPQAVENCLRPYQLAGFRWLACLSKNGLGAVLADDMGLGKTLQAISVLLYMKEEGLLVENGKKRPFLTVVPPGLLRNWQREFERWAPSLRIYTYHGPKRSLPDDMGRAYDVLLTTYEIVRNERLKFSDVDVICFSGMIIDEAQKIKNHGALVSKAIKEVGNAIGHTRIALSGTPIENKVDELHSIFDFVNYGYLGDQASFSATFSRIIEKGYGPNGSLVAEKRKQTLDLLQRLTAPFQMRRLKTDPNILPDLPEKIDLASTTTLTKEQEKLYAAIQHDFRVKMTSSAETRENHKFERRGHIFAMLEHARRVCSHPLCLDRGKYPDSCKGMTVQRRVESSGKTVRLCELLDEIVPAKEKAVVFATRKDVISVLAGLIGNRFHDMTVLIFTGDLSLQERNEVEQRFQTDPKCQLLLITLQCGGIGLNLTAANHVIHFDRCYNPAKEAQATDRCHRIGQKRSVCVHRLITEGTYEEQLEKIMARKQDLSSLTVSRAEDWIADYSDEALFDLFMLRKGPQRGPPVGELETPPRNDNRALPTTSPNKSKKRPMTTTLPNKRAK
ncbi:unnamed protein product [Durusdinium trenchii]